MKDWLEIDNDVALPEVVYLVAPGPNGAQHYSAVPKGGYVIAVNYALLATAAGLPPVTVWLCIDSALVDQPYWERLYRHFISGTPAGCDRPLWVVSEQLYRRLKPHQRELVSYVIKAAPGALDHLCPWPTLGCYSADATVVGAALTCIYNLGVNQGRLPVVIMLGVDMAGGQYFDGHQPYVRGVWPYVKTLNALIRVLAAVGMGISSISETALEINAERGTLNAEGRGDSDGD